MTAKIETEFIFETNIYFISSQKTVTFLDISKLLQYHTVDEIRWNPHLCRSQKAHKPLKHVLGDTKLGVGAVQFLRLLFYLGVNFTFVFYCTFPFCIIIIDIQVITTVFLIFLKVQGDFAVTWMEFTKCLKCFTY